MRECVRRPRFLRLSVLACVLTAASPALADDPAVEKVVVIGTTPLPGTGVDRDKIPGHVQSVSSEDVSRKGAPDLTGALDAQLGSVSLNDNLDDPFQPDLLFRGFEASPVLGTPEGLAVYQNGVRINEAFGDSLNWDLVPAVAIARVDVVSSNPVYGLNALGGAAIVTMKNGFTAPGVSVSATARSFGRRAVSAEYGANDGVLAGYVAGTWLDEDGWRLFSPDQLRQVHADVGYAEGPWTINLSFSGAENHLSGQSPAPVQELAVDRSLIFTSPQQNVNRLAFLALNGSYKASDQLTLQFNAYHRVFRQRVDNGNTTSYVACSSIADTLCQDDGTTVVVDADGNPLPDLSLGGALPIGQNDLEAIVTRSNGAAIQAVSDAPFLGRLNHLAVGASLDRAHTSFRARTEVGVINSELVVLPSGLFVSEPEGTDFNATPVDLGAGSTYYGVYASDTWNLTPELALTASARYNVAKIDLDDRIGTQLTGNATYRRLNPAVGMTYKATPDITIYAGYAEANRAPTPSEIECSDPDHPCLLPSSLSSDPPTLRQVIARTVEAGMRGRLRADDGGRLAWTLGVFRTDLTDDIYGVATSQNTGVFQNIGGTLRQGLEADVSWRSDRLMAYASYSLVDATFQSDLVLPSPFNPFADADGNIHVGKGDRLPGVPRHRLKTGFDWQANPRLSLGATATLMSSQHYQGDEANLAARLDGFAVAGVHLRYALSDELELHAGVDNLFDAHYATFGTFGDPTGIGAPGVPADPADADPRFQSPAAPRAIYAGLRLALP